MTSERTGKSEQLYKDLGTFIFTSLYHNMRRPQFLILKLMGVGTWHLRRMRMKAIVELFPPNFEKKEEDFPTPWGFLKNENKKEIYHLFKERLLEYEDYIKERDIIRAIRYKTQVLISPKEKEC